MDDSKKIKEAIEKLIDENYVRIPKKDFDLIIENRLSQLVNKKFSTLIGIIVGLISFLSVISFFQFNRSKVSNEKLIQAEVSNVTKESIDEFKDFYAENISSKLSELEKRMDQSIEFLSNEVRSNVDLLERENQSNMEILKKDNVSSINLINEQISRANNQITKAEEYMFNLEIENLTSIINAQTYKLPEDLERTQNLLTDLESKNIDFQIPTVVNLLSYIYYDQKMYNEVNDLISTYEQNYQLKSTTYINGALTAISDYHNYNSLNQRDKALEYLDKSINLTKGYGEALALKLEIYMMDYLRSNEEEEKNKNFKNTADLLHDILNGESKIPSYETASRLIRDYKIESYKKYISSLYILFPEQMKKLFNNANEISSDPRVIDLGFQLQYFDINEIIEE